MPRRELRFWVRRGAFPTQRVSMLLYWKTLSEQQLCKGAAEFASTNHCSGASEEVAQHATSDANKAWRSVCPLRIP